MDTCLTEAESGEPYILYRTNAAGAYVGQVRAAVAAVLTDIAGRCYDAAVFQTGQTQMAIAHIRAQYGDELEFLWPSSPENAVWRRKDSQKWYGALLTVRGSKLGLPTDRTVEILDLRMQPQDRDRLLAQAHYYPGWHMNKKSWYTLVLDGGVPDEELRLRIAESYALARK